MTLATSVLVHAESDACSASYSPSYNRSIHCAVRQLAARLHLNGNSLRIVDISLTLTGLILVRHLLHDSPRVFKLLKSISENVLLLVLIQERLLAPQPVILVQHTFEEL